MAEHIGYLYVNGLGDGSTTPKDRVVAWWWRRAGLDIQPAHVNWYDGEPLEAKLAAIDKQVNAMLQSFGGVALVGSSAGGSLALNAFYGLRARNVCAVIAHGRLRGGDYHDSAPMSLRHRAHLDSAKPSQSFFDSVTMAENEVAPALSESDKQRLLVLTQLTDRVVPLETMGLEGVQQRRSIAFGHTGGFVAHMLADRNIIANFAATLDLS